MRDLGEVAFDMALRQKIATALQCLHSPFRSIEPESILLAPGELDFAAAVLREAARQLRLRKK